LTLLLAACSDYVIPPQHLPLSVSLCDVAKNTYYATGHAVSPVASPAPMTGTN